MKKNVFVFIASLLVLAAVVVLVSSFTPNGQTSKSGSTPGMVSFTVTTLPAGGNYAPKHVLAVWIEKDGVFVKTRLARANQRKQYLYTWRAASNYNVVDAVTGSTLNSHQTHTIEWDCTDLNGVVVPDGNYTLKIEFTDKHAQGPLYSIDFVKGGESISLTPPNQPYFINMSFSYTPSQTTAADFTANVLQTCVNQPVVFTDASTGAVSWLWNFGEGANPPNATTQGPHEVTYSSSGPKTVSLTVNGNVVASKTDFVTIQPNAEAAFSYLINGNAVAFANESQYAQSYEWNFGDGTTSTEPSPLHSYAANGSYEVSLTAVSANCQNDVTTQMLNITAVGLTAQPEAAVFDVKPNPASAEFSITIHQNVEQGSLRILDAAGKSCFDLTVQGLKTGDVIQPGQLHLKPGHYVIELQANNKTHQRKLIVR